MTAVAPDSEYIRLSLPADHEYARIARIAMAALALRLGFSYREVQDLRLAIDESLILLLGSEHDPDRAAGRASDAVEGRGPDDQRDDHQVTIRFGTQPGRLDLQAKANFDVVSSGESQERFSTLISELVDEWHVSDDGASIRFSKRHRSDPDA